jgi:hypothetical protein
LEGPDGSAGAIVPANGERMCKKGRNWSLKKQIRKILKAVAVLFFDAVWGW